MNQNADLLIKSLTPDINNKCEELKAMRKEKIQTRIFALLCATVIVIPALLVFAGVSLTLLVAPIIFMCMSVVILLPILLDGQSKEQGGKTYEQA